MNKADLKTIVRNFFRKPKKPTKREIIISVVMVVLIGVFMVAFIWGILSAYNMGSVASWGLISENEKGLRDLYSNSTQTELKAWLPDKQMNFTDGLIWESHLMSYSENRPTYQNAVQSLKNGKGACGEFSMVFGAFCVAKGIPFRIVTVGYFAPNVVDHVWAQVNPSHDGKTWIHVEVTDTCDQLRKGTTIDQLWNQTINNNFYYYKNNYKMVLGYQLNENGEILITDVTSTFSPP